MIHTTENDDTKITLMFLVVCFDAKVMLQPIYTIKDRILEKVCFVLHKRFNLVLAFQTSACSSFQCVENFRFFFFSLLRLLLYLVLSPTFSPFLALLNALLRIYTVHIKACVTHKVAIAQFYTNICRQKHVIAFKLKTFIIYNVYAFLFLSVCSSYASNSVILKSRAK